MTPRTTELFIIATTAIVVLYDVVARTLGGVECTISVVLAEAGDRYPVIVGAAGLVFAHIWWPSR